MVGLHIDVFDLDGLAATIVARRRACVRAGVFDLDLDAWSVVGARRGANRSEGKQEGRWKQCQHSGLKHLHGFNMLPWMAISKSRHLRTGNSAAPSAAPSPAHR